MKIKYIVILLGFFLLSKTNFAQENTSTTWWNPLHHEFNVVEGQGWSKNLESGYDRLPIDAKNKVREPLWNLSKNSAGLSIRFRSNSPNIEVKYKLSGELSMPHMPTTGVSGLDLYAKNSDGAWVWVQGQYSFGKNSIANFTNLKPNDSYHNEGREYQLFLPLYNSVDSLEIGVPKDVLFHPLAVRKEKPIVVYGTSIAQGACASRPGMAWTAILGRKMDRPLINLAFSGNGLLEDELIDRMNEIEAEVYILDCLPNLTPNANRTLSDVRERIIASSHKLRNKNPNTPILLVEHAGYTDEFFHLNRQKAVQDLNKTMKSAYAQLKAEGITNIYLLTKEEIGLNLDSMVDGTHPNDMGMQIYANAYEKSLRVILNEPIGVVSTTKPVTQSREWNFYKWEERHKELIDLNKNSPAKICFFGNSIVHFWGGNPKGPISSGTDSWNKYFEKLGVRNFGFGWDRIENVLWRVYHGELNGYEAKQIAIMLGTNNLHLNSNEEIIAGLTLLIEAITTRQSTAKIVIIGILPRKENEQRILELNLLISQLAENLKIIYLDVGKELLLNTGKINEALYKDGLHPNEKGYGKIAPILAKQLQQ